MGDMSGELISPDIGVRNQLVIPDVAGIERPASKMDLGGPVRIGQSPTITETVLFVENDFTQQERSALNEE